MRRKITAGILAALIVGAWTVRPLPAQQSSADRTNRVPLINQIDDLGRTIFDGILSPFQQDSKRQQGAAESRPARYANRPNLVHIQREEKPEPAAERLAERVSPQGTPPSRANLWDQLNGQRSPSTESSTTPYANAYPPEVKSPSMGQSRTSVPYVRVRQEPDPEATPGNVEIYSQTTSRGPGQAAAESPAHEPAQSVAENRVQSAEETAGDPTSDRLYERMSAFRVSPFESEELATDASPAEIEPGKATAENEPASEPAEEPSKKEEVASAAKQPHVADAAAAPKAAVTADAEPAPLAVKQPPLAHPESTVDMPSVQRRPLSVPHATASEIIKPRSIVAQPTSPVTDVAEAPAAEDGGRAAVESETTTPAEAAPGEAVAAEKEPGRLDEDVLITRQSPVLDVRTVGPRRITVGKPAQFVVTIRNTGTVAADDAVVTIELPEWTDVAGNKPTAGTAGWVQSAGVAKQFQWIVGRLSANAGEQLTLDVVPRESQPFDLAVRWDYKPVASQTLIEVQEPKLEMSLSGPREILYGSKQVYRLDLTNSGTGDAENVQISLMPLGIGPRTPATHKLGLLAAGGKKAVEVELTARQAGELTVEVEARADAGAPARLVEQIVVVRPDLEVDVEAPPMQYAGAVGKYLIHVANPGTAAASNVKVVAKVPAGARHELSTPTASIAPDGHEVTWTVQSIPAGAEKVFTLHCKLDQAGASRLAVRATADNDLLAMVDATTIVETMPDLALAVKDPVGPVPVGTESTYQVAIQNRGTETAEDVEVIAYFSRGIEPISAEGGRYEISPGQVVFDKIAELGVGKGVSLLVHAKAEQAGNHVFRVEVYCKASGIRLVSEEMTHYYTNSEGPQQADRDNASEPRYLRTAERQSSESSQ